MSADWTRRDFVKRAGLAAGTIALGGSAAELLAACGAPGSDASTTTASGLPATIKIGMNTTLTGKAAAEGELAKKAADLAVEEINARGGIGGKAKIQLLAQDSQSTDQGAVTAFRKSIDSDAVDVFLGPVKSTQVLAMIDQINEAQIPTIVGGTNVTLTKKGVKWLFRMRPNDGVAAPAMVKYITEELKLTKVAILHDSDAFGTGGGDLVETALKAKNLASVRREKYTGGDKDFTAQLSNIKNAGPEIMVLYATNITDDGVILKQVKQLGLPFKIMGSPSTAQTTVYDLVKEAQDGIFATVDYVPGSTPVAQGYATSYKKKYGIDPDDLSAWAYDAIYVFADAIKTAGSVDKSKVRDAIAVIHSDARVIGTVSFDKLGDGLHSVAVVQMAGGKKQLKKVETVPPAS
jgi:branched-chain amino acid transport system substrate-binding protein